MSIPPGNPHLPEVPGMVFPLLIFAKCLLDSVELEETFRAVSWLHFAQMLSDVRFHLLSAARVFPVTRQPAFLPPLLQRAAAEQVQVWGTRALTSAVLHQPHSQSPSFVPHVLMQANTER